MAEDLLTRAGAGAERDGSHRIACERVIGEGAGRYLDLRHRRSGSRHLHIECDDDDNVFAVLFPTVPTDSTGVAHVLEHMIGA